MISVSNFHIFTNLKFSRYMAVLALIFKTCSVIFYTSAWWFYKPPPISEVEEEQEKVQQASTEISLVQSPSAEAVSNNGQLANSRTDATEKV